jgi:hypothetical protein
LRITILLPLRARDRTLLVGVRHDQARIDSESFAADKVCRDARLDHTLKDTAENVTVAEMFVAGA